VAKSTENDIELMAIELFEKQGYEYVYAPDIELLERKSFEDVVLEERLFSALQRINPDAPFLRYKKRLK
jgi:type I restriction enzyme R subunit